MSMDPQIKALLKQTIYVHAPNGVNNFGETSYTSTPTAVLARVELETGVTTGAENEEISYNYKILTVSEIVRYSRIWLPGVLQTNAKLALLALNTEPITGEKGENNGWWTKA